MLVCFGNTFCFAIVVLSLAFSVQAFAKELAQKSEFEIRISEVVQHSMEAFQVPGIAVGVIQGEQVLLQTGFGVRNIHTRLPVDAHSLFKIASNTKAFTSAALAILVDRGLLNWSDRIVDHLPEFALYDPWITQHFTALDMLTHRSGMQAGAGDLMLWPEPNAFTPSDVVKNVRYFKPVLEFRVDYAYDNLLYIVAGQLVARLSGQSWQAFVQEEILDPMRLKHCFAATMSDAAKANLTAPHALIDEQLMVVERSRISDTLTVMAAAGGMKCSVSDMLVWLQTLLNAGLTPDGVRLFSEQQSKVMWQAQMILPVRDSQYDAYNTHFSAYALGWRLEDAMGHLLISHTGSLQGYRSYVALLPELDVGVVILTNGSSSSARQAVMNTILDRFIARDKSRDWVSIFQAKNQARKNRIATERFNEDLALMTEHRSPPEQELSAYIADYVDPWFGAVSIVLHKGRLRFQSKKSPKMYGTLQHKSGDTFVVFWQDRTLEADAYVAFKRNAQGLVTGMSMLAVSPDTDFSFDFKDLDFTRRVTP